MSSRTSQTRSLLIALALMAPFSAPALADGGGGGGDNPALALIAPEQPSGSITLPGGKQVHLDGYKAHRDVEADAPNNGRKRGKHIKTTYNSRTGITSVWVRNADGTRTGIHTDRQGSQMVTEHSK